MKNRPDRRVIVAFLLIGIIIGASNFSKYQETHFSKYRSVVMVPTDADTVYEQEIQTGTAVVGIRVTRVEKRDYLPERYRLNVELSNSTEKQYEYKVSLDGYTRSLICDTSHNELQYKGNYSSGDGHNGITVYYFVPEKKDAECAEVGTLSFKLQRNGPDLTGDVAVSVAVYSPYTHRRIETITQQVGIAFTDDYK